MDDLDDHTIYRRLDPSNLRLRLRDLPSQCQQAKAAVDQTELPSGLGNVERVLVAGMGGSAIGGEILGDLASLESSVPVASWRDYDLPASVDEKTLVLVCSHSGETEETLSSFRSALAHGAQAVAITGGGALARDAEAAGVTVVPIDYHGEPRSAIGFSFLGPLLLLQKLGLLHLQPSDWPEMLQELDDLIARVEGHVPQAGNEAKQLAQQLHGRLPVMYGGGIFGGVARRWKTQLNENAKSWAFAELLPEAHHNAIAGYLLPAVVRDSAFVVLLRPATLHPRLAARYQATMELLEQEGIGHAQVGGQGDSSLSQIMTAVMLGDYASYYLALLNGVDPSPVEAINRMRKRLAELQG